MVSTTMYFFPGGEILRSRDLVHWEHLSYIYDSLDDTPGQRLEGTENIYGQGMWAACIRFHQGLFYVCFVANDTGKAYLYTASDPGGPWQRRPIQGFYHDCSLLFDQDGRVYISYGNRDIRITELKEDLSGPKLGGLDRVVVSDRGNPNLGYEGSHLYCINEKYYLFLIHSRRDRWRRTQACFTADSLEGEFTGGDVLDDDMGYWDQGVAQGGIVDTPEGQAVLHGQPASPEEELVSENTEGESPDAAGLQGDTAEENPQPKTEEVRTGDPQPDSLEDSPAEQPNGTQTALSPGQCRLHFPRYK